MSSGNYKEDGKPQLSFYDRGPGPAGVLLPPLISRHPIYDPYFHAPTHRINPEYTIAEKIPPVFKPIGPGAAAYLLEYGLKSNGKFTGYPCTIREKFPLIDKKSGLLLYDIPKLELTKPRAPAFTFGSRSPLYNKKDYPGPNVYLLPPAIGPRIPDKLAAPEVTFKFREIKDPALISAPGPYDIGPPDLIRPRAPAYTIRELLPLELKRVGCGPACYEPTRPLCKVQKGAHFGIRYNDFTGVFRTGCDKSSFLN